jgi:dolichyl-phosphate-mannose-protein mannosyltransferase
MNHFRRARPELIALIFGAIITRFWQLSQPSSVVFDEVYFKVFAGHYLDGHYFFDIHPPLGKLILAGWASLWHMPAASLTNTAINVTSLRYVPALAGVLLIPVFWGILRRLGANRPFAFLGATALLLDNALVTESRFILMDSMLLLFGLFCVYAYLVARTEKGKLRWVWLTLSALSSGAALSIKWTGLTAFALVVMTWIIDSHRTRWLPRLGEAAILVLVPVVVYLSVFAIHFQLLPSSGDGDAFMSPRFQATLIGNSYYDPTAKEDFFHKFLDLNIEMFKANQTLTATHPYGSRWYTWPLELRPIYYWEGVAEPNGDQGNIYLLGNPVVWWGIMLSGLVGLAIVQIARVKLRRSTVAALSLMAAAYVMNFAPFVTVTRVMFLYHYFFAFIFSLAFVILLWNDLYLGWRSLGNYNGQNARLVYGIILTSMFAGFVFFMPLTYGTHLSPRGLQARMWLHSWR